MRKLFFKTSSWAIIAFLTLNITLADTKWSLWDKGTQTLDEAESALSSGSYIVALQKFKQAQSIFEKIGESFPEWQSNKTFFKVDICERKAGAITKRLQKKSLNIHSVNTTKAPLPVTKSREGQDFKQLYTQEKVRAEDLSYLSEERLTEIRELKQDIISLNKQIKNTVTGRIESTPGDAAQILKLQTLNEQLRDQHNKLDNHLNTLLLEKTKQQQELGKAYSNTVNTNETISRLDSQNKRMESQVTEANEALQVNTAQLTRHKELLTTAKMTKELLDKEISNLREQLSAISNKQEKLQGHFDSEKSDTIRLTDELNSLKRTHTLATTSASEQNNEFKRIQKLKEQYYIAKQDLGKELDLIKNKLTQSEKSSKALNEDVSSYASKTTKSASDLKQLVAIKSNLEDQLKAALKNNDAVNAELKALKAKSNPEKMAKLETTLKIKTQELTASKENVADQLQKKTDEISTLQKNVSHLSQVERTLKDKLSSLTVAHQAQSGVAKSTETNLSALKVKVKSIMNELANAKSANTQAQTGLNQYQASSKTLSKTLNTEVARSKQLSQMNTQLEQKLAALEQQSRSETSSKEQLDKALISVESQLSSSSETIQLLTSRIENLTVSEHTLSTKVHTASTANMKLRQSLTAKEVQLKQLEYNLANERDNTDIVAARKIQQQLETEILSLSTENAKLKEKIEKHYSQSVDIKTTLQKLAQRNDDLEKDFLVMRTEQNTRAKNNALQLGSIEQLTTDKVRLNTSLTELTERYSRVKDSATQAASLLKTTLQQARSTQSQLTDEQKKNKVLASENISKREKIEQLTQIATVHKEKKYIQSTELAKIQGMLKASTLSVDVLKKKLATVTTEKAVFSSEQSTLEQRALSLEHKLVGLKTEHQVAETASNSLKRELETIQKSKSEADTLIKSLTNQKNEIGSELEALESMHALSKQTSASLKNEIVKMAESKLKAEETAALLKAEVNNFKKQLFHKIEAHGNLLAKLNSLKDQLDLAASGHRTSNTHLEQQLSTLSKEKTKHEFELSAAKTKNNSLAEQLLRARSEKEEISTELAATDKKYSSNQQLIETQKNKIITLHEHQEIINGKIGVLAKTNNELQELLATRKANESELEEIIQTTQSEKQKLSAELTKQKDEFAKIRQELIQFKEFAERTTNLEKHQKSLEKDYLNISGEKARLLGELQNAKANISMLTTTMSKVRKQKKVFQTELEGLNKKFSDGLKSASSQSSEIETLKNQNRILETQLRMSQDKLKTNESLTATQTDELKNRKTQLQEWAINSRKTEKEQRELDIKITTLSSQLTTAEETIHDMKGILETRKQSENELSRQFEQLQQDKNKKSQELLTKIDEATSLRIEVELLNEKQSTHSSIVTNLKSTEKQLITLSTDKTNVDNQLGSARAQLTSLKTELARAIEQRKAFQTELSTTSVALKKATSQEKETGIENDSLNSKYQLIRNELSQLTGDLEKNKTQQSVLDSQVHNAEQAHSAAKEKISKLEQENERLIQDLESTVSHVTLKEKELAKINAELIANKVKNGETKNLQAELNEISAEKVQLIQDLEIVTTDSNTAQKQFNKAQEQIKVLTTSITEQQAYRQQSDVTLAEQKVSLAKLNSDNKDFQAQMSLMDETINTAKTGSSSMEAMIQQISEKKNNLAGHVSTLTQKNSLLSKDLAEKDDELRLKKQELEDYKHLAEQKNNVDKKLVQITTENSQLQTDMNVQVQENTSLKTELKLALTKAQGREKIEKELESANKELLTVATTKAQLTKNIQSSTAKLATLTQNLTQANKQKTAYKEELQQLSSKYADSASNSSSLKEIIAGLNIGKEQLISQLKTLQAKLSASSTEKVTIGEKMASLKNEHLSGQNKISEQRAEKIELEDKLTKANTERLALKKQVSLVTGINDEKAQLEKELKSMHKNLMSLSVAKHTLEKNLQNAKAHTSTLSDTLEKVEQEKLIYQTEVKELTKLNSDKERGATSLKSIVTELGKSKDQLLKKLEAIQLKAKTATESNTVLNAAASLNSKNHLSLTKSLSKETADNKQLQIQLATKNNKLTELEKELKKIQVSNQENKNIGKELKQIENEYLNTSAEKARIEEQLHKEKSARITINDELVKTSLELKKYRKTDEALKKQLVTFEELKVNNNNLTAVKDKLKETNKTLGKLLETSQAELKSSSILNSQRLSTNKKLLTKIDTQAAMLSQIEILESKVKSAQSMASELKSIEKQLLEISTQKAQQDKKLSLSISDARVYKEALTQTETKLKKTNLELLTTKEMLSTTAQELSTNKDLQKTVTLDKNKIQSELDKLEQTFKQLSSANKNAEAKMVIQGQQSSSLADKLKSELQLASTLASELESTKQTLRELKSNSEKSQATNKTLQKQLSEVSNRLTTTMSAEEDLTNQVDTLKDSADTNSQKLAALQISEEKLVRTLKKREEELLATKAQSQIVNAQLKQHINEGSELSNLVSKSIQQNTQLEEELAESNQKYATASILVKDHETLITELQEKNKNISDNISSLSKNVDLLTTENTNSKSVIIKKDASNLDQERKITVLAKNSKEYLTQIERLIKDNTMLNKKYTAIFSDVDRFEKENEVSRKELQQKYNSMKSVLERSISETKRLQSGISKYRSDNTEKNTALAKTMKEKSSIREVYITLYSKYDTMKAKNNELRLSMLNLQQEVNKRDKQFEKLINENIGLNEKYLRIRTELDDASEEETISK